MPDPATAQWLGHLHRKDIYSVHVGMYSMHVSQHRMHVSKYSCMSAYTCKHVSMLCYMLKYAGQHVAWIMS